MLTGSCLLLKRWKDSSQLANVCETFDMSKLPSYSGIFKIWRHVPLLILVDCLALLCSVVIRGQPSDDAVVCTERQTYELKLVETSNTLLLAPSLKTPKDPGKCYGNEVCVCVCVCVCVYCVQIVSFFMQSSLVIKMMNLFHQRYCTAPIVNPVL